MTIEEFNYFVNSLTLLKTSLSNNLPYVSGRMRSSVKAYAGVNINDSNQVLGTMTIEVPYAKFVNYGFVDHPNSIKLKRDYKIVERTLTNTLRAIYQSKGATVE